MSVLRLRVRRGRVRRDLRENHAFRGHLGRRVLRVRGDGAAGTCADGVDAGFGDGVVGVGVGAAGASAGVGAEGCGNGERCEHCDDGLGREVAACLCRDPLYTASPPGVAGVAAALGAKGAANAAACCVACACSVSEAGKMLLLKDLLRRCPVVGAGDAAERAAEEAVPVAGLLRADSRSALR